jgi:phage gp29-like protein
MTGLWINDHEFLEFAASGNQALFGELAVRDPALSGFLGVLPDPDPVLRKSGEDVRVLADLSADWKVTSSIQGRKLKTLNKRDYRFEPGHAQGAEPTPEAKRLCDELVADLERVNLANVFSGVLDAPYFGYTPLEIMWTEGIRLRDLVAKPWHWFAFDDANRLCWRGENGVTVMPVPQFKFVLAQHFPTYDNPYGLRLLSRCLFPVAFKRGGIEFLMRFAEKFGMPWIVGEARPGAQDPEMRTMSQQLSGMIRDAVAVVPAGAKVTVHEMAGKASELHPAIIDLFDGAIAQVLQGQTLTQQIGKNGSYAASQTHYNVLEDFAAADQVLVETAMTDLAWVYGQVRAPGVLTPVFTFVTPEDKAALGRQAKDMYGVGARFTATYFERRFGLAPDEFTVAAEAGQGQPDTDAGAPAFAAPAAPTAPATRFTAAQQAVENLVARSLPAGKVALEGVAAAILELVAAAETPEDLELLLAEACPDLGGDLETALEAGLLAADLTGRYAAAKAPDRG